MRQDQFLDIIGKNLSTILDEYYNKHMGFAVVVFDFHDNGTDYVSNAIRADMVKALREAANQIESKAVIGVPIGNA